MTAPTSSERPRAQGRGRRGGCAAALLTAAAAACAAAVPTAARGQTDSSRQVANLWLVYNGTHAWSSRWALLAEAQWRRTDFAARPKQLLLRTGLEYTWTDRVSLGAGYTYLGTSPHGPLADPISSDEHRAFEQVSVSHDVGRVALDHRLRVEQRWQAEVESGGGPPRAVGRAYANRGRYQIRATRPLHAGDVEHPGWYATATGEPFLRFGRDVGRAFDQSRVFVGLGYRWKGATRIEGGYLRQDRRPAAGRAREANHALHVSLYSEAPLRRRAASGR